MGEPSGNADLRLLDGVSWRGAAVPGERSHELLALLAMSAPKSVRDTPSCWCATARCERDSTTTRRA
jgi:hypothetical protein